MYYSSQKMLLSLLSWECDKWFTKLKICDIFIKNENL